MDKIKYAIPEPEKQHEITLPSAQQFSDFYSELTELHRLSLEPCDNTIAFKAADASILISAGAIIELIADKFKQPLNITEDMKLNGGNPQFIDDIDGRIAKKLDWMQAQFGRIFTEMQDIEVKALCEGYHRTLSLPLIAKIRYLEWERLQTSHKIQLATEQVEIRKNEEIAQIRREYKDKSEQDQTEARKKIEYLEGKVRSVTETNKSLDSIQRQDKQDIKNLTGELEDSQEKLKDAEAKGSRLEAELHTARSELETTKEKLKQYSGENGWEPDVNSTPENPIFINTTTKKIITLPEDFKSYKPTDVKGDEIIYKHGGAELKLPIPLAEKLREQASAGAPKPQEEEGGKKEKIKLTPSEKKVMDALRKSEEPLSVDKLSAITSIHTNHLYSKYLKRLVLVHELVLEDVKDGVKVFSAVKEE